MGDGDSTTKYANERYQRGLQREKDDECKKLADAIFPEPEGETKLKTQTG